MSKIPFVTDRFVKEDVLFIEGNRTRLRRESRGQNPKQENNFIEQKLWSRSLKEKDSDDVNRSGFLEGEGGGFWGTTGKEQSVFKKRPELKPLKLRSIILNKNTEVEITVPP